MTELQDTEKMLLGMSLFTAAEKMRDDFVSGSIPDFIAESTIHDIISLMEKLEIDEGTILRARWLMNGR